MPALESRPLGLHVAALLCALVAAAIFYNSLQCGLVFDDESAIKNNKDLRPELRSWWDLLKHDFWGATLTHKESHKSYRPLTVATFRLNYMLHGLEPLGYHLVNVLLHSGVCYLYVLLCGVVFSEVWPALIAGLLFAVHPIHTEAVRQKLHNVFQVFLNCFRLQVLLAEQKHSLQLSSSLPSYASEDLPTGNKKVYTLQNCEYDNTGFSGSTGWHWILLCLLFTSCSVLSKEQGLTVMAFCVVYDFFFIQKV